MFANLQSTQKLKPASESSYSNENVYSETNTMNGSPSKSSNQPLSGRRQSNFGMEKHHQQHQFFDKKDGLIGGGFGYDDISNHGTPIHNPHISNIAENSQENSLVVEKKVANPVDNRHFNTRNSVSVSFTHPQLAAIVNPKEIKNLGRVDNSLSDRNVNIVSGQDIGEKSPIMFKELGDSFVLHSNANADGEETPVLPSKNKVRRSRNDRSKQTATTAETEADTRMIETKQNESSIHTPSVNEIDPCQNNGQLSGTRQTTEKSEENIFNKTLVSNESLEKDLPMQISDHQLSFQTLLDNLQISKDVSDIHKNSRPQTNNPFSSQIQTENSLELHNVYEELPEQRAMKYATRGSDGRAKSCVQIFPYSMNKSELESLYDKLESPTKEDKMVVERQVRSSRSYGNIFQNQTPQMVANIVQQASKINSNRDSGKKVKRSGELNLPLQQSHSGKKSANKSSLSMDRGNSSSYRGAGRNFNDNVMKRLNLNTRNCPQQEDLDMSQSYTEDYYDNIDEQRLSLHVKMAVKDNPITPPQYSARIPTTRSYIKDDIVYSRVKTQQCEKSMKSLSGRNRVEREYLADVERKKRLAEIVFQTNSTTNKGQRQKSASNIQNKKVVKKTVPVPEDRLTKSKMQTRRESHVDMISISAIVDNKRDVSNEKSVNMNKEVIIDKPLQMKPKKEELHLGSINTLRLKRQNPDNVLFNKSQNKPGTRRAGGGFGSITDRISFNDTVVLNKSQDLGRSFTRPEKNKNVGKTPKVFDGNKTQEVEKTTSEMSIRETKGWSNTLEAVMSGISVGGVNKTWESLTRKITTTVNNNEPAKVDEQKEMVNQGLQAQIVESTATLTHKKNEVKEITSQFDIKNINLDRLALMLLRQTEEKAVRRIQRFVIRKYKFKTRKFNSETEHKANESIENLFKHYEELYSRISGSLGVEGTKFSQKELAMTFITISCFLDSKEKSLTDLNRIQN